MKKIAIVAVLGFMPLVGAFAQQDTTVNRTVIVENEYNPTVMDASKINVMPQMSEPKATKKNINYATSLRPVSAWDYRPCRRWCVNGSRLRPIVDICVVAMATMAM